MGLFSINRNWQHMRRYRQILGILLKYGFGDVVDVTRKDLISRFGDKIVPLFGKHVDSSMSRAKRLRYAAEELGPTFIKLAQVLSMRPDLVPPDVAAELRKLQDEVAPISYEEIRNIIKEELNQEPETAFLRIDGQPLAAASIAQVHRAVLPDGKQVVLKVQRPGIQAVIDVDLEILSDIAGILTRHSRNSLIYNPEGVIEEFNRSIHRELDFISEGHNIQRFGRMFADDPTVFIPTFYSTLSTTRLLVMDYVDGVKVSRLDEIERMGLDRVIIAKRGSLLILNQVFDHGFFHADPHPGNIMVLSGNVIAPLDYGMVGNLDESTIDALGSALAGMIHKDTHRILRAFKVLGITQDVKDKNSLRADLNDFISRYYEVPLKELQVSTLLKEIFEIVRKHQMVLPSNLSLMLKSLVTVEGLGQLLYPEFDMVSEVRPYIRRITLRRYDPRRRFRNMLSVLDDLSQLAEELPQGIRDTLNKINRGELRIQFEHRNLENFTKELNQSSNRISSAVIIAALIIGSSLVMQVSVGPNFFGFPLLGVLGYIVASMLGLTLLWNIFRSKRQ
ncbi:MAG: ubiquinone biosynthesis protein UbiB [candidate division Zixibacteria bacterium]|nr:ubiquinone biosynthesis protein UbiB [candidate division Zixibacteria bacterium]